MTKNDRRLGMGSPITRRDFLNGVAMGVGGATVAWMSPDLEPLMAQGSAGTYPPALTGLRGSHPVSFEALHAMSDGAFWKTAPAPRATGEEYDLVAVGAGISGRAELLSTSFETVERTIRDQLGRVLGGGGFDPAADILGITVNRWPHGYAYQYNSLSDDFWLNDGEQPCAVARRPHGRIAIANSDAAAYAYTDAAIDHAHRAVQELLG